MDSANLKANKISSNFVTVARQRKMIRGLQMRVGEGLDRSRSAAQLAQIASEGLKQLYLSDHARLEASLNEELTHDLHEWDTGLEDSWSKAEQKTFESLQKVKVETENLAAKLADQTNQEQKSFQQRRDAYQKEYDTVKLQPVKLLEKLNQQVRESLNETAEAFNRAEQLLIERSQVIPAMDSTKLPQPFAFRPTKIAEVLSGLLEQRGILTAAYESMRRHPLARTASSVWVWLMAIFLGFAVGGALGFTNVVSAWMGLTIGVSLGLIFVFAVFFGLRPVLNRVTSQFFPTIQSAWVTSQNMARLGYQLAEYNCKVEQTRLLDEFRASVDRMDAEHRTSLAALQKKHNEQLTEFLNQQQQIRESAALERHRTFKDINRRRQPQHEALRRRLELQRQEHQNEFELKNRNLLQEHKDSLEYVERRILRGAKSVASHLSQMRDSVLELFPIWQDSRWTAGVVPRNNLIAVLPIGDLKVDIGKTATTEAWPAVPRVGESMPMLFQLVEHGSLLIEAESSLRRTAQDTIRELLLRALTSLPAGGLQMTIIDPEGLGRDFGWLMQLADTDPKIVNHRVWTQPTHISEQLGRLTHHTEDVIQQLLRDRYADIREYNAEAGSMAEPFRIVVWSQFPFGVDENSWKSLCSLIASGGRCGVSVILLQDPTIAWPPMLDRNRLADVGLHLKLNTPVTGSSQSIVTVLDPIFEHFPLTLREPPADDVQSIILENCARAAHAAGHIEVPFETIVPISQPIRKASSAVGLEIPIGQSGVGRSQFLRLGSGTSQHVLIAGKTGSGKSSLLHTLITSAALKYAPDQLRLVLLDFKKGVEFQSYAEQKLAHADIIGIESQREFGLSTFEYLDRVMQRRGELFRQESVQDIPSWVRKNPDRPMPRILIVVDEFQEIFVEDDKLAQQASMLLDRIVRQGRSFGMHVVLASQTLGGAYSLPRTTLAQMAVRIALQCEGADAMIILSEDNLAAERLRYSGQAIYNDASGRVEGNQPFQVAYLSKEKQTERLSALGKAIPFIDESNMSLGRQIIFEGHRAAAWNSQSIQQAIEAVPQREANGIIVVLGDSVSIEPAVAIQFSRQTGRNVVMIGTEEENAASCLTSILVSGRYSTRAMDQGELQVCLLDGNRPDDTHLAKLPGLVRSLYSQAVVADPRTAANAISKIGAELEVRLANPDSRYDSYVLVISQLGRFRDLRRGDEFAFGTSEGETKTADGWLQSILRDGPAVGIHSVIWVDNANTLARWLPRQSMHDLEVRVLMQMSSNDSNQLIDSPLANRLNPHVLLVHDEATGRSRKFRPYHFDDPTEIASWATDN